MTVRKPIIGTILVSIFNFSNNLIIFAKPHGKNMFIKHCFARIRRSKGKALGYDYRNYEACSQCQFKSRCTISKKGPSISYNMKRAMSILGIREMLESLKNMKPALL